MKELIAYETWYWVMWLRWRISRQDLAWWTGCKCEGQVEWWLGTDGPNQRWRASEVKIDEPIRSHDDMKWITSFVIGWCMCWINIGGDEMECARQRYICRAFYFTGQRLCREVHDRVSNRRPYYEERQTYLHIGHLVPLKWSNFALLLGSSGMVNWVTNPLKKWLAGVINSTFVLVSQRD